MIDAIVSARVPTLRTALLGWFDARGREFPWRAPQRSPYEVLIAELLLKRTTATAAARHYLGFLAQYRDVRSLHAASQDELTEALRPLGLHVQRASAMCALAESLVSDHDGRIPNDLSALLALPGVGPYSARAVMSFAYGEHAAVVDANVERVFNRVFGASLPLPISAGKHQWMADAVVPSDRHRQTNFALLDLGALVCRYDRPRCDDCPLSAVCDYAATDKVQELTPHLPRLRTCRKARGLTLLELAALAGVSKMTIVNVEHGRTCPRQQTVERLADALGLPPGVLRGEPA
jgi:A/G-specific adenine glycosylase